MAPKKQAHRGRSESAMLSAGRRVYEAHDKIDAVGAANGRPLHPLRPPKKSPSSWPEGDFPYYFANVSMNRMRIMAVSARVAVAFGFRRLLLPFSRPEPTAQRIASAA